MIAKPTAPAVTPYKNCLIVERDGRVDIVDTQRGLWMQVASVRTAKWTISVWGRLNAEFKATSSSSPLDLSRAVGMTGRPRMETFKPH